MESIDIKIFTQKFIEDADELLNELENNLLDLESKPQNNDLIEAVFRAMHTLKGVGSMYGFHHISQYTHTLENIYDAIRNHKMELSPDIFDVTFRSVDHLRNLLSDIDLQNEINKVNHETLSSNIQQLMQKYAINEKEFRNKLLEQSKPAETTDIGTWQIILKVDESILFRGIKLTSVFEELAGLGTFHIEKQEQNEMNSDGEIVEFWEIFLISNCSRNEIEDVMFFLIDDCKINKISNCDISKPEFVRQIDTKLNSDSDSIIEFIGKNNSKAEINRTEKEIGKPATKTSSIQIIDNKKQTIAVTSDKLDSLMFIVSEMVTLKSELHNAGSKQDLRLVMAKIDKFDKLTKVLRNITLSIRLVPLSEMTLKFKRLIRDLSQVLNKKVELITQGNEVELDKNLIDMLADPIMHLIRNCLDHGIEIPEMRAAKGKPETGIIKINAYQSGNFVHITVSDNGNGIDPNKIKCKAVEKGYISEQSDLTDKEILSLIFLPGFSTAEHLTQVSGRGVGMDVVKRKINELRGEVEIESKVGEGTTFTIKLQQTLSIMDTLMIKSGASNYIIPIDEVVVCEQVAHSIIAESFNTQIRYKDNLIPFVYLRSIFKIESQAPKIEKVVIVEKHNRRFAIIADSIVGEYQAVLKPVGDMFKDKEFIAGASIMGNGEIAIMLDTNKLCANFMK